MAHGLQADEIPLPFSVPDGEKTEFGIRGIADEDLLPQDLEALSPVSGGKLGAQIAPFPLNRISHVCFGFLCVKNTLFRHSVLLTQDLAQKTC